MIEWLTLSNSQRQEALNLAARQTGLPEPAIEKDWWVTLTLKAAFSTPWAQNIVFKGGTSLSKSWNLIERFSEDIDLALDREALNFTGILTKTQIKKLREASAKFMNNEFRAGLQDAILNLGVPHPNFMLFAQESSQSDVDPSILVLRYISVLNTNTYLSPQVLIEIGVRSLREPCSPRSINSIIGTVFTNGPLATPPFDVLTVDPRRTFLEKIFLLHEEFQKPPDKIRHERLSRHLYDIERLMDTPHATEALADTELYNAIIEHRKKFTAIRGIDYSLHGPGVINFIPPDAVINLWEADYAAMREMIHGETLPFKKLIDRLIQLRLRFMAIA